MDTYNNDSFAKPLRAPKPECVDINLDYDALNITYRWWSVKYIFLFVFCIAWDSFLIFWYSMATKGAPLIMILFPVGHVAVGIGLTYYTIAGFVNRTVINVNRQWLSVTHGPIPWYGNKRIDIPQVIQLFAEEVRSQNNRSGMSFSYQLNTLLRDNSKLKLLAGLPSPDIALFVEQNIEDYLNIKDQPVIGEMPKSTRQ
jgi:hypothetical protein